VILLGAHIAARAGAGPGGELARRRERLRVHPDFGDHLLRRIYAESGHLGQPDHRILMFLRGGRHHLAELVDLLVQQLQAFEMQLQKFQMAGLRRAMERVG
jgi:hypothetical protein